MGFPAENSMVMRLEEQIWGWGCLEKVLSLSRRRKETRREIMQRKKTSEKIAKERFKGKEELRRHV